MYTYIYIYIYIERERESLDLLRRGMLGSMGVANVRSAVQGYVEAGDESSASAKHDRKPMAQSQQLRISRSMHERLAEYGWKPHRYLLACRNRSPASSYWYVHDERRGNGFIEFEISNIMMSTVFRQLLNAAFREAAPVPSPPFFHVRRTPFHLSI